MKPILTLLLITEVMLASGTLKNTVEPVLWSGTVTHHAGPTAEVPECAPGCQRFDLTLDLPGGVWNNKPGGVEIALRWPGHTLSDNLKLYVYRDGVRIASSAGIISTAQSVLIPAPHNGLLKIYAVFDDSDPLSSQTITYEGLAEVEYPPNPRPTRRLLPNLTVRPQRNLSFDPVGVFFDTVSTQYPTCYVTEVEEQGARLCLRFDQIIANIGEGPMELRYALPAGTQPPTANAFQRIYWSDGPAHYEDHLAGPVEFHPAHGHYHFSSFGLSSLWSVDAGGHRTGSRPIRRNRGIRPVGGHPVRTSRKIGFCLADILIDFWGKKGDGPRTYNAPDCLSPASTDGTFDHYFQGITSGWADVYDWYLPDQFMEVTGVPDGVYLLQTDADPENLLIEASDTNNCGSVYVRLSNLALSTRHAELLGPAPGCATLLR